MKLLTEELKQQLPPLYSQENVKDPMVICKFFHPLSSLTWYAIEGSPVDENGYYDTEKEKVDFLFFGWIHSDQSELVYFSLNEMEAINVGGLGIERDLHFTPKPLSAVKREQQ
jgi:Protein of unknown function (DUF2958)